MDSEWMNQFVAKIKESWGPLSTEVVADSRISLEQLARAVKEKQLGSGLLGDDSSAELYRDPKYGFVLTIYAEEEGQYRAPHDHGAGWVVYAVAEGAVEMGTYSPSLVRRDSTRMTNGDAKVFLPGDIHDTLCLSGRAVILRLTSVDLKKEDAEGRMKRYPAPQLHGLRFSR